MGINFAATRVGIAVAAAGETSLGSEAPAAQDALIDNRGSVDVYIRFGPPGVTVSVATGVRVPAGSIAIFGTGGCAAVAVAVASGAPSLVVHLGAGV